MLFFTLFTAAAIAAVGIHASPYPEMVAKNLSPSECSKVVTIVEVLKAHKATPFCSSFLSIKPTTTTTTVIKPTTKTTTKTSTITQGVTSTSVVFKPGNPPKAKRSPGDAPLEKRDNMPNVVERGTTPTIPPYLTAYATTAISSACECLDIPTPTATTTKTSTKTSTRTVTVSKTVQPSAITSTYYPCATPIPTLIPTLPYGLANQAGVISSENSLHGANDPADSLEGCCNLCFFGSPNCIQAYYYSYEGCVIQQATELNGTGVGVSSVCPSGKIDGLTYNPDTSPPFRSTGSIAGPCGVQYNNLG